MDAPPGGEWSFANARVPADFTAAVAHSQPDVEHALGNDGTLCGIAYDDVAAYRHHFARTRADACPACSERAEAAPTRPCGQERLHRLVGGATPSPLRDELLDSLERGARIRHWMSGPNSVLKHYLPADLVLSGRDEIDAHRSTEARITLALVEHADREIVVLVPAPNAQPILATARRRS